MKIWFVIAAVGLFHNGAVHAAPAVNPSEVQTQERPSEAGQLLTIGVNSGRQIEFRVVGHKTMNIDFSEKDVTASINIGQRQWLLTPKKGRDNRFTIEIPADAPVTKGSEINLRLRIPEKK